MQRLKSKHSRQIFHVSFQNTRANTSYLGKRKKQDEKLFENTQVGILLIVKCNDKNFKQGQGWNSSSINLFFTPPALHYNIPTHVSHYSINHATSPGLVERYSGKLKGIIN